MGRFLDGGLLANNPTLDAMTEIHQYNKALRAEVGLLSPLVSSCVLSSCVLSSPLLLSPLLSLWPCSNIEPSPPVFSLNSKLYSKL